VSIDTSKERAGGNWAKARLFKPKAFVVKKSQLDGKLVIRLSFMTAYVHAQWLH